MATNLAPIAAGALVAAAELTSSTWGTSKLNARAVAELAHALLHEFLESKSEPAQSNLARLKRGDELQS